MKSKACRLLERLPLSALATVATIGAFVLGTFSAGGNSNPNSSVRLFWGAVLAVLNFTMILSGLVDAVKSRIALGALRFVFELMLLVVCVLRALFAEEELDADR